MIPATGSCRKAPEIVGTWKQYFGRKIFGVFPGRTVQPGEYLVNNTMLQRITRLRRPLTRGKKNWIGYFVAYEKRYQLRTYCQYV
jgi:hypothetical protein